MVTIDEWHDGNNGITGNDEAGIEDSPISGRFNVDNDNDYEMMEDPGVYDEDEDESYFSSDGIGEKENGWRVIRGEGSAVPKGDKGIGGMGKRLPGEKKN